MSSVAVFCTTGMSTDTAGAFDAPTLIACCESVNGTIGENGNGVYGCKWQGTDSGQSEYSTQWQECVTQHNATGMGSCSSQGSDTTTMFPNGFSTVSLDAAAATGSGAASASGSGSAGSAASTTGGSAGFASSGAASSAAAISASGSATADP